MARWKFNRPHFYDNRKMPRRMLKKAVQQGRSDQHRLRSRLRLSEVILSVLSLNLSLNLTAKLADFFSILLDGR